MKRKAFDEAIANMFSNYKYSEDYLFYAHIIAQCRIIITTDVPTAGINFKGCHYNLYINPDFFNSKSVIQRLAILKHESLHILYNHISRFPLDSDEINHENANLAMDCAINQFITKSHFEDLKAIYPENLSKMTGIKNIPIKKNSETYYDLIKDCKVKSNDDDNSKSGKEIGDHEIWKDGDDSKSNDELRNEVTKKMVDKAIEKSRGHIPNNISNILDIWNKKAEINWQKALKHITANKKQEKQLTIMRKSRRFPKRNEIYGVKKINKFNIVIVLDISGSMSDEDILTGLKETKEIVRISSSALKIIQVDTEVHSVEDFNPKKRNFIRNGNGGTEMLPAMEYIINNKLECDCVILISDMYIEDISLWKNKRIPKVPYIFISTSGKKPEGFENFKGKYFNLENK